MTARRFFLLALFAIGTPSAFAGGPADNYYLTAGDSDNNALVKGANATISEQAEGHEYGIAVSGGDVRTETAGNSPGAEYNLNFVGTGTQYASPRLEIYDGTTDGTSNFGVSFGNGDVYSMGLDWSSPVALFSAGASGSNLGITYDSFNQSLWVSNWSGTTITDYSMTGSVLSSFNTPVSRMTALAFDQSDGTLWFGSQSTPGTFYQYGVDGAPLGSVTYANLANLNVLGGEFNFTPSPTPEPFTIGLGLAGIALAARRRLRAG